MKNTERISIFITIIVAVLGGIGWIYAEWISPIEQKQYDDHSTISGAVANISNLITSINDIQSRVDWLTEQKGYVSIRPYSSLADTTNPL